jgi:hypothetical protein
MPKAAIRFETREAIMRKVDKDKRSQEAKGVEEGDEEGRKDMERRAQDIRKAGWSSRSTDRQIETGKQSSVLGADGPTLLANSLVNF